MPEATATRDRIDGWEKIASHLKCDITTAIRWARCSELPVYQPSGRRGAVHAFRHELDAWFRNRKSATNARSRADASVGIESNSHPASAVVAQLAIGNPVADETQSRRRRSRWGIITVTFFFVTLAVFGYQYALARLFFHAPQLAGQQQLTQNGAEKNGLLADGKSLYFGQAQDGRMALAAMPAGGGPIRILWNPPAKPHRVPNRT